MNKRTRSTLTLAFLTGLWGACAPTPEIAPETAPGTPATATARPGFLDPYVAHKDERSGLPTFIWLNTSAAAPAGKDASEAAGRVLRELAPTYRMSTAALATVQEKSVHDLGRGSILVKYEQQVDGLEVFLRGVTVALDQHLRPVAASGNFAPTVRRTAADFQRPPSEAIAAALQHVIGGSLPVGNITPTVQKDRYTQFAVAPVQLGNQSYTLAAPARTKQVLFPGVQGLIPAYYVELNVRADDGSVRLQSFVIAAADNAVLYNNDMTANDAYSYRVWADGSGKFLPHSTPYGEGSLPHPTGKPDGSKASTPIPATLVSLSNAPFSKNDPWLGPGATEAKGNNVWAYADIATPDGFGTGDVMLPPSAPGVFDYSIDPAADPTANDAVRRGAITQLFYTLNFMHDTFYDAGWDEKSGNSQLSNYGRGGVEGDAIKGEAQDNSGTNNANCSTPADGASVRIQMYNWTSGGSLVTVLAPADLAKTYQGGTAAFGPQSFSLTNNLVLSDDGAGASTSDGCEPFVNAAAVAGKFAVMDRGTCGFAVKTKNAQDAGAVGAVIVNNAAGAAPGMAGVDATITIPAVSLSQSDGTAFKAKLTAGTPVQLRIDREANLRDGSLDTGVVMHEWGHSLSNRLIGNAGGLSTSMSKGLGEGWSDFVALLTLVRPEAAAAPSNPNWNGTFALAAYALRTSADSAYYGIRRYPYSSDLTKNPLTFQHISTGVALPAMPPSAPASPDNAEVHNVGEIWAAMLWDCYTNMLRDTSRYTFDKAQSTMREYLVASLKMTPNAPTLLEARDALLATMYAHDPVDSAACAASFARRKAGIGAVAPNRNDTTNAGVVESDKLGPDLMIVGYKLDDSARSCDNDGIIDNTETGRLVVTVRNTGTSPLSDATVTVSGDSQYFYFQNGGTVRVPPLLPYQSGMVTVDFGVKGAPAAFSPKLHVAATAASLVVPRTLTLDITRRMNYDVAVGTATTDTFGVVAKLGWSVAGDTTLAGGATPWTQVTDELGDGLFTIPDNGSRSDQYLVSPPIVADAAANLGFTIKHRFNLEADTMTNYDAAIVEISADNGQTWTDIGSLFTSGGYNGMLNTTLSHNPLQDYTTPMPRPAFVGKSAGFPAFMQSTADLGTAYAGKTVRLRFRVGTDEASGGVDGWTIDEISVTGVSNKPFAQSAAQVVMCMNRPPTVTVTPSEQSVPIGGTAQLQGLVSDADTDSVVYEWVQLSGPVVVLAEPTALNQAFTIPTVTEATEATFALRATDGKEQSEAVAKVTFALPADTSGAGAGGCGCRTVPSKTRAADAALDFLLVMIAGLYCHRRRLLRKA